jgi:hypothetical protein
MDLQHALLQLTQALGGGNRLQRFDQVAPIDAAQQLALGGSRRIAKVHAHQESIQLRLRQRKCADLILWILRGDDEEWLGQRHRLAVERDLVFFHRLEQRALRLGRGAVDFVRQHQLREDRAALETKFAGLAVEYRHPEHIRRQQVAGELNALKRQAEGLRQAVRQGGFADAGDVLDEQMAARQQAGDA